MIFIKGGTIIEMNINPLIKDIFQFKYEDFNLINYNPDSLIKAPVAV